jgi:hypothetical protein
MTEIFITIGVRTSNPAFVLKFYWGIRIVLIYQYLFKYAKIKLQTSRSG